MSLHHSQNLKNGVYHQPERRAITNTGWKQVYLKQDNGTVQSLGLTDLYKNDPVIRSFIHKTAALAFVPLTFVRIAWSAIEADAPAIPEADAYRNYFVQPDWTVTSFQEHGTTTAMKGLGPTTTWKDGTTG